jgi:hypothetical protein
MAAFVLAFRYTPHEFDVDVAVYLGIYYMRDTIQRILMKLNIVTIQG